MFEFYVLKNVYIVILDYIYLSDMVIFYIINGSVLIVNNELVKGFIIKSYEDLL